MKVSELNRDTVASFIRADVTPSTLNILDMTLRGAIAYCSSYTGLTEQALEYEDMTLAVLALCAEFYDNRTYTAVENAAVNPTTQAILDKYSMNLIEGCNHVSQG